MRSAEQVLIDMYGCKDLEELQRLFLSENKSVKMAVDAMEQYAAEFWAEQAVTIKQNPK